MFEAFRNWLYSLLTNSGIVLRLIPFMLRYTPTLIVDFEHGVNYKVADEDGSTVSFTKYNGKIYPPFGVKKLAGVSTLKVRQDDVFLCGYPKSGCHWVYEILHMIVTRKIGLTQHGKVIGGMIEGVPPILLDSMPSPRVLNSHLLYEDLPSQIKERKNKIVLTVRSPKDTLVSYYNHVKQLPHVYRYDGSFTSYFKLYMAGKLDYGSYFDHNLDWDKVMKIQKDNPILVVEYEKLKKNPLQTVKAIAMFLDIDISDNFTEEIIQATEFHTMKYKRRENFSAALFRKGTVGDWRNWMTEDQSSHIDQVWKERMVNSSYQPEFN